MGKQKISFNIHLYLPSSLRTSLGYFKLSWSKIKLKCLVHILSSQKNKQKLIYCQCFNVIKWYQCQICILITMQEWMGVGQGLLQIGQ